jgi:phenylacetic acid degradation operon negative regulatory protein
MRAVHLAELRAGVWTRPDNLGFDRTAGRAADRAGAASWWTARPEEDPKALARRLFAPDRWQAEARRRVAALEGATDGLAAGLGRDSLATAFATGALALRHIRGDPLLPPPLLPAGWLGPDLRTAYRRFQTEFSRAARGWFRTR